MDGLISESAGINNTYLSNEKSIKVEKSILPTLQSKVLAISEQITTTEEIKGVDAMEGDESMSKEVTKHDSHVYSLFSFQQNYRSVAAVKS